jgi:hypothetical protein
MTKLQNRNMGRKKGEGNMTPEKAKNKIIEDLTKAKGKRI